MNTAKIILGALLLVFSLSFAVDVTTCGVLNTPGTTYNVLNDLTTATGDCIVIDADNVNLNGNGYSISATSGTSYAVYVTEGSDNVHVDRALLENSMVGLRAGGDGSDPGSDVTLVNGLTLTYIVARNNVFAGFELIGLTNSLVEHNTAFQNTEHGFYITESDGNLFQSNNEWLSNWNGFYVQSSSNNRFVGNTARQNTHNGFEVVVESNGNVFDSNIAEQNSEYGFILAGVVSIIGTHVPDGNRFISNTANDNGVGIRFVDTGTQNGIVASTIINNLYGGILVTRSPGTDITSNTLTNNAVSWSLGTGILVKESTGYVISDNTVTGSLFAIRVEGSDMGTLDNTVISGSANPLLLLSSTGNQLTAITVVDSGPVLLRGDAAGNSITLLTMRGTPGEVTVDIPVYDGDYDVSVASAPGAAPSGYSALNRYVSVLNTAPGNILLVIHYEDSDLGTLDESTVGAMLWGGSWSTFAQDLHMGNNAVSAQNPGSGTFGLFAGVPPEEPPVVPPVTPPSGGSTGGSSGGSGSGGRAGSGGAVHIGVPYVASSGGEGFGGEATPSCTSDSECASSATCSGGICTALEAGSSCGTFQDHEWVDFECCDTSGCSAGEVCRDNTCTALEPLVITPGEGTTAQAPDEGIGRLLADVPWWVLALLLLMVGGGIYARYAMGREPPGEGEEEMPPAGEEEE